MVFWSPNVTVRPGGLNILNVLRSYRVDWSAVSSVGIGMALTISTDHGQIVVWAAPASSTGASRYGRAGAYSRLGSDTGDVALFVRARWIELQRAGKVPDLSPGVIGSVRRWRVAPIGILAVLMVAAVATLMLSR